MTTKNTPIAKDWFVMGLTTGCICALGKTLIDKIMAAVGMPPVGYARLARQVLCGRQRLSEKPLDVAMDVASDMVLGGIIGTGLHAVYGLTPPGNEALKGMLGGSMVWAASVFAGTRLRVFEEGFSARHMASMLITNVAFGALQGAVIGKYQAKTILQSHPILVKHADNNTFDERRLQYPERERTDLLPRYDNV